MATTGFTIQIGTPARLLFRVERKERKAGRNHTYLQPFYTVKTCDSPSDVHAQLASRMIPCRRHLSSTRRKGKYTSHIVSKVLYRSGCPVTFDLSGGRADNYHASLIPS